MPVRFEAGSLSLSPFVAVRVCHPVSLSTLPSYQDVAGFVVEDFLAFALLGRLLSRPFL